MASKYLNMHIEYINIVMNDEKRKYMRLSIVLDAESLKRLEDGAKKFHLPKSTYLRLLLLGLIGNDGS